MPLVVGGIFAVIFVAIIVAYRVNSSSSGPTGQTIANVRCDSAEQLATHYHAHLELIYRGTPVTVPAQIGITPTCFYWLHTHQATGIIHIEAPKEAASRQFTLGDFFKVWDQPLSSKQVSTLKVGAGEEIKVWVDGQPYTGDITKVVLKSHTQVVVEIGPPFVDPPPGFDWSSPAAVQEAGGGG